MHSGRFDALIPTHEQAWLFAAGRHLMPERNLPVAPLAAYDSVASKIAFASTLDDLGLPQPAWRPVHAESELAVLGYPVWVKAAHSTAGRGVALAHNQSEAIEAWRDLSQHGQVMIQMPAAGSYAQVQGVFEHGRLVGAAASALIATGAGGSAAARISVDHPKAIEALRVLGSHLSWHGGIALDYFHVNGEPAFIECNPRTVEPGNAAKAGVNLPELLIRLVTGPPLTTNVELTSPGVRTRSTMAIALGSAERIGTRRAVLAALASAVGGRGEMRGSEEVLTPIVRDPFSIAPAVFAVSSVLANPVSVRRLAQSAVDAYGVTTEAVETARLASRDPE
ncbi:carbamoyl-phosphate-synthetase [Nocardioides sp. LS1]|uniref:carbamoyl-phosphate-synthetase n=1 Tax=Nocardioides sp. LS1 TaxID=1027620 RepID=UPI000FFAB320|nr:carbamoyl-phosphate-synthetase [Nocardioides sp. LS1]GCD88077.1 carboxylate--amine ligase [Nocardioides sp. LS1]